MMFSWDLRTITVAALHSLGRNPGRLFDQAQAEIQILWIADLLTSYGYACGRIDGRCGCSGGQGGRLDERDIALRQQAYSAAHRILAVMLIAAAAILTIYLASGSSVRPEV